MKLKPLHDNIIIEMEKLESKTKLGLIVPQIEKEAMNKGKVVSVGPGGLTDSGKIIPSNIKKGDIVYFQPYGPQKITFEGKEYLIVKEADILAVIEK